MMRTLSSSRFQARGLSMPIASALHYLALAVIVVVGSFLRLTALNRQSLWFDEIDAVVRAHRPMDQVLRTFVREGENGPLYNLLLALWVRVAGISEIAVRFPSAVAGILSIPLIYLLGRRLAGPPTGLLAAGLLAISPYHVWYSQEAKMYALVVLLSLLSTLALVEALERNRAVWWLAWVACTTLMFYTHVTSVLVFVAQVAYVVGTRSSWRGRERAWLVSVAALTLPYVPIALWATRVVSGEVATWQPDVGLWEAVRIFGIKFAVNRAEAEIETRSAVLVAILAGVGLVALFRCRRRERWWMLVSLLTVIPIAGLYLFSLRQSVFSDRYAIVALPAYLILVAVGLARLARHRTLWPLGALAMFLAVAFTWQPLRDVNRSSAAQKEDWRSAWADVARNDQPGDAFIVQPGYVISTVEYFNERVPELRGHAIVTVPTHDTASPDLDAMVATIRQQSGGSNRLWLIQSPDRAARDDPDARLRGWLDEVGAVRYDHEVNGVRITLYELPRGW